MKFPRTSGGACREAQQHCRCSRKSCQTTHFQAREITYSVGGAEEEAVSVYEVVLETGSLMCGLVESMYKIVNSEVCTCINNEGLGGTYLVSPHIKQFMTDLLSATSCQSRKVV